MSKYKEKLQNICLSGKEKLEILEKIHKDIVNHDKNIQISDENGLNAVIIDGYFATLLIEEIIQHIEFDIRTAEFSLKSVL